MLLFLTIVLLIFEIWAWVDKRFKNQKGAKGSIHGALIISIMFLLSSYYLPNLMINEILNATGKEPRMLPNVTDKSFRDGNNEIKQMGFSVIVAHGVSEQYLEEPQVIIKTISPPVNRVYYPNREIHIYTEVTEPKAGNYEMDRLLVVRDYGQWSLV